MLIENVKKKQSFKHNCNWRTSSFTANSLSSLKLPMSVNWLFMAYEETVDSHKPPFLLSKPDQSGLASKQELESGSAG